MLPRPPKTNELPPATVECVVCGKPMPGLEAVLDVHDESGGALWHHPACAPLEETEPLRLRCQAERGELAGQKVSYHARQCKRRAAPGAFLCWQHEKLREEARKRVRSI